MLSPTKLLGGHAPPRFIGAYARGRQTSDDADAVHQGRVVPLVDEMRSSYCLDAERRLAEVEFTSPVVEVQRRELVACQRAAHADRQSAEEAQLVRVDVQWTLGADGVHGADLMSHRVDVDGTVQQSAILCQSPARHCVSLDTTCTYRQPSFSNNVLQSMYSYFSRL